MLDKNSLDMTNTVLDEHVPESALPTEEPSINLGQLENDAVSSLASELSPIDNESNDGEEHDVGTLDLSSLSISNDSDNTADEQNEGDKTDAEALYHDTVALMKTGKTDLSTGVKLLLKAAHGGYAPAWMYLGQIYSNKKYALYNPALAFDCFCGAADLGFADGHYNKGLCYSMGFGCEKDELYAIQSFARGAESFDPNCICAMAMCYEFGQGCDVNYEYAFNLYQKGTELGHAGCANNLGGCYLYGHGVAQNKEYAVEVFKKAAELGSTNAKCRLGLCQLSGDGCEKDEAAAFECFKSAAEEHNPIALYNLAACYDTGVGCEQNFRLAYKYYSKAASLGHAEAQYMAGKMSMDGRGTKRDATTAYSMFSSSVRLGYAPADYELANCFFEGAGAVRNRASAYNHYLAAYNAQGENAADAAYRLGLCHLKGLGAELSKTRAVEWFRHGVELGSPNAAYMLAECLHYGVGIEKDDAQAFSLYSMAAQRALSEPLEIKSYAHLFLAIAQCYERGIGARKDGAKAIAAYKQASELGDDEALYRTGKAILSGVGMRPEYPAARTHFLRAARHSYMPAMLMMGIFSEYGNGIPKNPGDAKNWFFKAVSASNDPQMSIYDFPERFAEGLSLYKDARNEADYRYGMMLAREGASSEDRIRAFEYISLSAANGYNPAKVEITKIHISGGDLKAYYESPFSHEDATFDNGHTSPSSKDLAIAMYKLGDAFFDGSGLLKKNETASAHCYKTAAELGMIDACYSYGWCLRHGVGVDENDAEAVKWLKLAADKGNSNAAYSYGLCCEEGAGTGVKNKREAMYYYRIAAASGNTKAAERYVLLSSRAE